MHIHLCNALIFLKGVQSFPSSEVSAFAMTMSVNGSALESLYNAVSEGRGHILEEVRASNTRAEMRVVIDPALQPQQTMAGTSSMDDGVVDWNITFLDRTGLSTGVILATVSPFHFTFLRVAWKLSPYLTSIPQDPESRVHETAQSLCFSILQSL
jgi:hypothetical protein